MRGKTIDRASVIWFMTEILGGYNDWFTCDIYERKTHTLMHLRHFYDRKWSLFCKHYLAAMFEELLNIENIQFELTSTTLTFRLPKNK